MPIELAHDPVLLDADILDCVAQTPFDAASRISYLIALGRAVEQKVLDKFNDQLTNVVPLGVVTTLNLDPDLTLGNLRGKLQGFVIVGYAKDDSEFFASTYADGGDALWLLERCKKALLESDA